MNFWESFWSFLFPPRCIFCCRVVRTGELVCPDCLPKLEKTDGGCLRCAAPLPKNSTSDRCPWCAGFTFTFKSVRAVSYYRGEWRKVIHRFKYGRERHLARPLAQLIYENFDSWEGLQAEVITAVPLHYRRLQERGYNQSALLARELSRLTNIPYVELLERKKDTPSQTGLNREERLRNLRGAFHLRRPLKKGMEVLVVDDVFTTGATAEAATNALVAGGAGKVFILVAAR
ncbi:MAG: ComF family protein [Dethiobacteria bacterium]